MGYPKVNTQEYPLIRLKNTPGEVFELIKADWTSKGDEYGFNAVVQSPEYGVCSEHTDNIEFLSTKQANEWRERKILIASGIEMNVHTIGDWNCENSPIKKCVYHVSDETCIYCEEPEERK